MQILSPELFRLHNMEDLGFGPSAMRKIKKCPNCGEMVSSEYDFCQKCGTLLSSDTLYDFYKSLHKVCPSCDAVVNKQLPFCPHCGASLKSTAQENTYKKEFSEERE